MSSVILVSCWTVSYPCKATLARSPLQCVFLSSEKATSDPVLCHWRSHGTTRYITRYFSLDYCNSALAGLPASIPWRLCNEYKMRLLDLCSTLTDGRISHQYCSSCTGCLSSTASSSRSRRWCTTLYTTDVRRISPAWLHSTRQTLNDFNSGRHKPELQSWNGHGRNLANARLLSVWSQYMSQQSTTLVIMCLDELWSHLFYCAFIA